MERFGCYERTRTLAYANCCCSFQLALRRELAPHADETAIRAKQVVQAVPQLLLRSSIDASHQFAAVGMRTYTVRDVHEKWLFVVNQRGSVKGWTRSDQVVPIERAIDLFTARIQKAPNSSFDIHMRAYVYESLGRLDEALHDIDSALTADPSNEYLHVEKSNILLKKHRYDEAEREARTAIRFAPTDMICRLALAHLNYERNLYDASISNCDDAIRINPAYADAYVHRAQAWRQNRQFALAITDYTTALNINPRYTLAYSARGQCWQKVGEFDKAIADFDACLREDSEFVGTWFHRGCCWYAKKDFKRSIDDLSKELCIRPDTPIALYWRGLARCELGDSDHAIMDLTDSLRIEPDCVQCLETRGHILQEKGNYKAATADLKRALELSPNDEYALACYAWLLATCPEDKYRNGALAVTLAQRAAELSGWKESSPLAALGCAFAETGNFRSAIEWAKKSLEILPDPHASFGSELSESLREFNQGRPPRQRQAQ